MPFTAGDFTPSAIAAVKVKEADLLTSPRGFSEANKEIVAGAALLQHQDPTIVTLGQGVDCMNAAIYLQRAGSTDKGNKTVSCNITAGPKGGTEKLDLTKESLVNHEIFTIDDTFCANAETFTSQLAYLGLKAKLGLELKLSKLMVSLANTNRDNIEASWFETVGEVETSNIYEVLTANFKADLLADIQWGAKAGGFNMPLILNGRNFFNKAILDQYASNGCCTNDAILNRNAAMDVVWDAINVDSVTGKKSTFVVDKNSLLFWSSAAYNNIGMETMVEESNDTYHWVETLPRLQYFAGGTLNPIYVNVRAKRSCLATSVAARESWNFEMWLTGAATANLADNDGKKGIIRIDQVAAYTA